VTLLDRSAIAFLSILDDAIAASAEVLQLAKEKRKENYITYSNWKLRKSNKKRAEEEYRITVKCVQRRHLSRIDIVS
jgi:hypothetical protein